MLGSPTVEVSGKILTTQGTPPIEPLVVVLSPLQPTNDIARLNLKQGMSIRQTGDFTFVDVPPGNYRLLAFDKIPQGFTWSSSRFVEPYLSQGTLVTVDGTGPVVVNTVAIAVKQ
jgi:hypothetical protein